MKVGSLFSGIGGLDLGLERAGMEVIWQVENDPYCQKVLAKHWPDVPRYGDIKEIDWNDVERPDLICGGFPCQPVSLAGKRLAQADERWLWPEVDRCIRILRPRFVLLENVPGLLSAGISDVLGDLAASGYDAEWDCIPAAAVGAPHIRYRVWIVAHSESDIRGASWHDRPQPSDGRNPPLAYPGGRYGRQGRQGRPEHGGQGLREQAHSVVVYPDGAGQSDIQEVQEGRRQQGEGQRDYRALGGASPQAGDVPDAHPSLRDRRADEPWRGPERRTALGWDSWWATEPDVGRVAHGVSPALDGIGVINAHEKCYQKARATGDALIGEVRTMWGNRESATALSQHEGCCLCGCSLSEMPCGGSLQDWLMGTGAEEGEDLRDLWVGVFRLQPHEGQDLWAELFERTGATQRIQKMGTRVDRLRGLGNAVVPQLAEWIGRRILDVA